MRNVNDFFSLRNTVKKITEHEYKQTEDYLSVIKAYARTTYKSIYIIDYQKKGFEYVSENPLFLCGHTPEQVEDMGYEFYFKYVVEQDIDLLVKINNVGFNYYEQIPRDERIQYCISYDFHLKNQEGKTFLINQKLTPLFLTSEGKIWKALCIISLSNEQQAGNIKIFKNGENKVSRYNEKGDFWETEDKVDLSFREKEVLKYSVRGFSVNEMAESMCVSANTVKYHRKNIFEKLEVSNITEAIVYATYNKLI